MFAALLRFTLSAALVAAALCARAAAPPPEPILRVETGMHTAQIRRLAVDAPRNRLVTVSDDKTLRVWQLPQARLIATHRVPIGPGHEGQLFALAVSPDGRTIAAGGWTGWDWERAGSVHLFDIESGEAAGRIGGLPDAIGSLQFSRDGQRLAVGLQGRGGLRILARGTWAKLAEDREYRDKILELDFDAAGRLVTCALDGLVRLYDAGGRLIGRVRAAGGAKPASVRFSPDGESIVVGFADVAAVAVLSARDLKPRHVAGADKFPGQRTLASVSWSQDGGWLYAAGEHAGAGAAPLFRWPTAAPQAVERIGIALARITELQPAADGGVFFVAEDPAIGRVDRDGGVHTLRAPQIGDFRDAGDAFAVSHDGATVRFPMRRGGEHALQFSLAARTLGPVPPGATLAPALREVAEFALGHSRDGAQPTLNGVRLALDDYEIVHSDAVAPDRGTLLLGTEWALRAYDRRARERWTVKLPATARAVNVSGDGALALAALSDGTIRWYRMEDGRELLALFVHANATDWIAWTPAGWYVSSPFGDNHIGWHFNRGREQEPDFFRAVQFERVLYRPDKVAAHLQARGHAATRGAPAAEDVDLAAIAPPRVKLRLAGLEDGGRRARLQVLAEQTGLPLRDAAVFVNNIPVTPGRERALPDGQRERLLREVTVALDGPDNDIRVEVFNGRSLGIGERWVAAPAAAARAPEPGTLYVLAVGVNRFPGLPESMHLSYAAQDADALAARLAQLGGSRYRRVETRVLSDAGGHRPDRAAVLEALGFVQAARAQDTVIVFLASHGLSDAAGNYYFFPRDAALEDVRAVPRSTSGTLGSLLPWTAFFDALRNTAGRRVLIVDTCQARNIEGTFDARSLAKRSASSQFALALASQGGEESQEYAAGKHGLFTWALLDGLSGGADANGDRRLSITELFAHAAPLVERLHDKAVGAQTPQLIAPAPLDAIGLFALP
jgi:hypothetical protein